LRGAAAACACTSNAAPRQLSPVASHGHPDRRSLRAPYAPGDASASPRDAQAAHEGGRLDGSVSVLDLILPGVALGVFVVLALYARGCGRV
jgi:hypothetical protein